MGVQFFCNCSCICLIVWMCVCVSFMHVFMCVGMLIYVGGGGRLQEIVKCVCTYIIGNGVCLVKCVFGVKPKPQGQYRDVVGNTFWNLSPSCLLLLPQLHEQNRLASFPFHFSWNFPLRKTLEISTRFCPLSLRFLLYFNSSPVLEISSRKHATILMGTTQQWSPYHSKVGPNHGT